MHEVIKRMNRGMVLMGMQTTEAGNTIYCLEGIKSCVLITIAPSGYVVSISRGAV